MLPAPRPVPEMGTLKLADTWVNVASIRVLRRFRPVRFPKGSEVTAVSRILPLAVPLETGVKVTLIVVLCPAFRVRGELTALRAKPRPDIVA